MKSKKPEALPEPPKYLFRQMEDGAVIPGRVMPGNTIMQLGTKVYEVAMDEDRGIWLDPIKTPEPPKTVYGDALGDVNRYFRTFERLEDNMGVLFVGTKGSGKTVRIRTMIRTALGMDMPVICVNRAFPPDGLAMLVRAVNTPSLWVFEEFDKTFTSQRPDGEDDLSYQNALLSIFDGTVAGGARKLYVLAANDENKISDYMKHRPGRIRYTKKFEKLPHDVMMGYVKANLKTNRPMDLVHFAKLRTVYGPLNFDIMQTVVDELNHNSDLNLVTALNLLFCDVYLGGRIQYLAEVTMPDGEVHVVPAYEDFNTEQGARIAVMLSSLDETEEDIHTDLTLSDKHFVSANDDYRSFFYERDGYKVKLKLSQGSLDTKILPTFGDEYPEGTFDENEHYRKFHDRQRRRQEAVAEKRKREKAEAKTKGEDNPEDSKGKEVPWGGGNFPRRVYTQSFDTAASSSEDVGNGPTTVFPTASQFGLSVGGFLTAIDKSVQANGSRASLGWTETLSFSRGVNNLNMSSSSVLASKHLDAGSAEGSGG